MYRLNEKFDWNVPIPFERHLVSKERKTIIHNERVHYLREISTVVKTYHGNVQKQAEIARKLYQLQGTKTLLSESEQHVAIDEMIEYFDTKIENDKKQLLDSWNEKKANV